LIDVQRLTVLREVARAGSFAGAAAALHHTPSAVSQQISALERGAGAVLVRRSTRGVILTDAGRALLATADAIHAELALAEQRLRALAEDRPLTLTVVTFHSAGEPLLAPSLSAMTAAVGRPVEITVIEAEPEEALPAIRDGRADLALVYHFHTSEPPPGWPAVAGAGTYVPLVADPLRLLVPAGHPLAGRAVASLADVADERWIQGWGDVGDAIDMLAALSGFRPQVACRSSDYRFISALVGAGVGVALVSSLALTGSPQVHDLPVTPALTRYIGAWLPRRHQPNPAAEQLLTALRAQAGLLFAAGGAPQADREGQSGYQRQQPPGGQRAPGQGVGDRQAGDNRQGEEPVVADDEVVPEGGEGLKPR
jgi:DNA-binding transcriptional LysR family regulator